MERRKVLSANFRSGGLCCSTKGMYKSEESKHIISALIAGYNPSIFQYLVQGELQYVPRS